ncbi:MAG: family 43 glycosylhydrolase [Planctomycetota bacterium]|nr:family 43 glycosylhydrolase [Planctomycetota bacterium]
MLTTALLGILMAISPAVALDGMLAIHDPSTVIKCDGKYYVFGTGRGIPFLASNDGFTWERKGRVFEQIPAEVRLASPKNNGSAVWAPDIIQVNGQYYLYYAVSSWNSFVSGIGLMTNSTLDPANPKYKWTDGGLVVNSVEGEDLNAIDPGVARAPDGTLWLCYGSYHGNIQLVELDPKTGGRISPKSPVWIIASRSEASDIIHHDAYYYLLVNHGSCCQGKNSTYNIRVGRSAKITGPYLDRHGEDLTRGGGTLFLAAAGTHVGPGHFGRLMEDGVEKFSCHYEADLEKGGRSMLDIRPLLWTADGWPAPGENVKEGTYQLMSKQTGTVLQVAPHRPATGADAAGASTMPDHGMSAQMGRYLIRENQKWMLAPVSGGFYKIIAAGNGGALEVLGAAVDDKSVDNVEIEPYTGAENQLWKIDQFADGSYRLSSKMNKHALTGGMDEERPGVAAKEFSGDDTQKWIVAAP